MVFRLYISLSEIFHCFHNNLNSTTKELKPTIFEMSKKNFTPVLKSLRWPLDGYLLRRVCLERSSWHYDLNIILPFQLSCSVRKQHKDCSRRWKLIYYNFAKNNNNIMIYNNNRYTTHQYIISSLFQEEVCLDCTKHMRL